MNKKLYTDVVTPQLLRILKTLMESHAFDNFRLVGGTALSLYRGHRISVDIDLFTDALYGSIDFNAIDNFLRITYPYVDTSNYSIVGMGKPYYIGGDKNDCIKLDLYYTDDFIQDVQMIDGIRLATLEEIIAMKIDVISRGGRKKDFWDIHELMYDYSIKEMLALHEKRYPYTHDQEVIKANLSCFTIADEDFDPICLRNNHWEIIKLDMIDFAKSI
jgi:hypothetical protein